MNRNFFVRLAFATHRVADALENTERVQEIREKANAVLANLILFTEKEMVLPEKKRELAVRLEQGVNDVLACLDEFAKKGSIDEKNFSVLQAEYERLQGLLEMFSGLDTGAVMPRPLEPVGVIEQAPVASNGPKIVESSEKKQGQQALSARQQKIIEFLKAKENVQVWELQKVLPEVTKRTLRRDLDELLQKELVERKGEWNAVAYALK